MHDVYFFAAGVAVGIAATAIFHQKAVNLFHESVSAVLKEVTMIRADIQDKLDAIAKKL